MKEALFYTPGENNQVRCELCRFRCVIGDGGRGICAVRENHAGILYSLVYGRIVAEHVDPVEKKPLFHFMPGSLTYSIATSGCNFHCRHCQNHSISQVTRDNQIKGIDRTPQEIVEAAIKNSCRSISFTYTEPTVFYEFALETAQHARKNGLANIFVTNGYISKAALVEIAPFLDAANIDLKGFNEEFYRNTVKARLSEVLDSIIEYRKLGIWIEITTLIIPDLNDSDDDLHGIARFIAENLGPETPWHVSQFYPTYQLLNKSRTPLRTLQRAKAIGLSAGLKHVYEGNVPGEGGENSFCPDCSNLIIERYGYRILSNSINGGRCPNCGRKIAGISL
jgi:pyruvate formate lyase activating enzyme